jgi:hypothetical protein
LKRYFILKDILSEIQHAIDEDIIGLILVATHLAFDDEHPDTAVLKRV